MKTGLAIFGIAFGAAMILAAIFEWRIIPWPTEHPTIGTDGRKMPPAVRASAAIIGALFVLLGILTLAGVL